MTIFGTLIFGFTSGEDLDVLRTCTGVTPSDALVKAWLTVKARASDADPGILQKIVTTISGAAGQITADGSAGQGNGTAQLTFHLSAADTALLAAGALYLFDVQVKTAGGKIYTVEEGSLQLASRVTGAIT